MKILAIPLLAAVLGQGDDPAKVMKALEDKVARADVSQVTVDAKMEGSKGNSAGIKGTLTVAADNKARGDFTMEFLGKSQKNYMVSDGTRMVTSQDGKAQPPKDAEKHMRNAMTVLLARSGLAALFMGSAGPDKGDPLTSITASDFEKVKTEKLDGRDALVIEYKLTIKGQNTPMAATVWVDTQTQLPLKRVVRAEMGGETVTLTETYSNIRFNPKLGADFFQLPK